MTPEGIEQLKIDEGFRGQPYLDTVGKTTIGYGRNLDDNPLTEEEAEYLMEKDVKQVEDMCNILPFWGFLNKTRKDIIVNMVFNLGFTGFLEFKNTIFYLNEKDYENAADEMLNSRWASQVGDRSQRLSLKMREG